MPLSMQQVQKMSQRLIMTPQMQQSIQLLQMNSMDLEQLVRTEMMENPFLELADEEEALASGTPELEPPSPPEDAPPDTGLSESAAPDLPTEADDYGDGDPRESFERTTAADEPQAPEEDTGEAFERMKESDVDWNDEYSESDPTAYQASAQGDEEERDFTTYTAISEGLYDSLRRQLRLSALSGEDLAIGEFIIGNVNEDGYLDCSLENLALMLRVPMELVAPDRAGKPETVDRRLRVALASRHGGVSPDAYASMKRRELILRLFAHYLGTDYERVSALKRELLLRRVIARRMKRRMEAFDAMPLEDLALEVIAYRLRTTSERVYSVLEVLQEFEPTGVCARSLSECLRIQCEELGFRNRLLYRILDGHLDLLLQKKFRDISRALGCKEEEAAEVFQLLARCEPHPGRSLTREKPRFIQPDVYVKKVDGKYMYFLHEGDIARLTIASRYRRMLKNAPAEADPAAATGPVLMEEAEVTSSTPLAPDFSSAKYKNAIWLIKNIEKRKSTILRVTEAIMEYQKAFLEKGIEHLRPLTLRDIGEMVGMHESTIARVTTNKYVETPRGIFELKYFFNSGLDTEEGDMAASRAIKEMIQQLIGAEDGKRPLSDQKIADILKKRGINIARRTVAKYREQLKILPARLRRDVGNGARPEADGDDDDE
jgi:RNA polymerase sigma-54 factor